MLRIPRIAPIVTRRDADFNTGASLQRLTFVRSLFKVGVAHLTLLLHAI